MQGGNSCCLKLKDLEFREIGSGPARKIEHKGGFSLEGTGVFQLAGCGWARRPKFASTANDVSKSSSRLDIDMELQLEMWYDLPKDTYSGQGLLQ